MHELIYFVWLNSRNCTKAGGGREFTVFIWAWKDVGIDWDIAFSINYAVEDSTANINDPHASLKIYEDANTDSGNRIQVPPHLDPALYLMSEVC